MALFVVWTSLHWRAQGFDKEDNQLFLLTVNSTTIRKSALSMFYKRYPTMVARAADLLDSKSKVLDTSSTIFSEIHFSLHINITYNFATRDSGVLKAMSSANSITLDFYKT